MVRKILGSALFILGGLLILYFSLWPITGNHGATWPQFLPVIVIGLGVLALGAYLMADKTSSKHKRLIHNDEKI